MIDDLATWKSQFTSQCPIVSTGAWTTNVAQWMNDRTTAKAQLTNITNSTPSATFTFAQAVFKSNLDTITPNSTKSAGANAFANAWEAAINMSVLNILAGAFIGGGGPSNTWSSVSSSVIDPASVTAGKAHIVSELSSAPTVDNRSASLFEQIFRDAFLLLTGTVTGLDSQEPPQPLIASNVPFV